MIHYEDILHLSFLKKTPFKGSDNGMRYMLKVVKDEEGSVTNLSAVYWPEPFSFESTPDEEKTWKKDFSFDTEGIRAAIAWLNEAHEAPENQSRWRTSIFKPTH